MPTKTAKNKYEWNLKLLYKSAQDPQIEKDVQKIEKLYSDFADKYDTKDKKYLTDVKELEQALTDYERTAGEANPKPILYFTYLSHMDSRNNEATSRISLYTGRLTKASNKIIFFEIALGTITAENQKKFLNDAALAHFRVFLKRVFDDAKHTLSVAEEKILNLKNQPSYDMWVEGLERTLGVQTVSWKGKELPLPQAQNMISGLPSAKERAELYNAVTDTLKKVSDFAEAEMNAVVTNKKINDEIRGYSSAYESTIISYRNDPKVVEKLVDTVSASNKVAHEFHKIKAKLLGLKKLSYADRAAKIGKVKSKFEFKESILKLKRIFGSIDQKYADILDSYIKNGQIDAFPRVGKRGGAYCSGAFDNPTFVLLNDINDLRSFTTIAHEMGHAFHTDFSAPQGPIYSNYSMSLAETASTLFESIALEAVFDTLPEEEKIIVLHDQINDDIATIFRQIACFKFEKDIHTTAREKGFVTKQEIADLHNKNMQAYLGPAFDLKPDDGYFWVSWPHLRYFFYVYSYAFGMLVSKALLRRYRKDPTFWKQIEIFLSAGGKASPEEILAEIGIDVYSPKFWQEGIDEIADNIKKLEKLARGAKLVK